MPSAPLYYRPLVDAAIRSTPVGSSHVAAAVDRQVDFVFVAPSPGAERQIVPTTSGAAAAGAGELRPGIEASLTGLTALTDGRKGAQLNGIKLSFDDEGYVANRALSVLEANPQSLDMDSPEQASQRMAQLMQQVAAGPRQASIENGVLDLPPALSNVLAKQWQGKEFVSGEEAASIATSVSRQVEIAALTGLRGGPAAAGQTMTWLDDAAVTALTLWPGTASRMSQALGLTTDPVSVEKAASQLRESAMGDPGVSSLARLLSMAGVDATLPAQREAAVMMLQGSVPHLALAEGIAKAKSLPSDRVEWLAGRLLDVAGRPGNVDGLEAEIARLLAPPPTPAPTTPEPEPGAPATPAPSTPAPAPDPVPPISPAPSAPSNPSGPALPPNAPAQAPLEEPPIILPPTA